MAGQEKPALDLWLAYVPVDREQRINHSFGLMMIRRPSIPGIIHLFWPFIRVFTDGIFSQDQHIVEEEQKAYDAQGGDLNQEIFPVIKELRGLLIRKGIPLDRPPDSNGISAQPAPSARVTASRVRADR
jgi:hypothetical protein